MNNKICIWIGCLWLLASCDKEIGLEAPAVSVTTESNSVKQGENVVFLFDGNADLISFYSGELYNEFEFKDGRSINIENHPRYVEFTSSVQGGSQQNQLSIWISTDFQQEYTYSGVNKATWTDITDKFTWGTDAAFLNSSLQDITGISDANKPVYFAFRYITEPQLENGDSRLWYIQNFQVLSGATLGGAMLPVVNQEYAGFRIVEQDPDNAPSRSTISSTRISFQGYAYKLPTDPVFDPENPIYDPHNPIYDPESPLYDLEAEFPIYIPYDPDSPYNDPRTETWAVSGPIELKKVDLGPDKSIPIKGVDGGVLRRFTHTYQKPGTYNAYFVITNHNIYNSKNHIEEIPITINP